jgi:hypothetical protein
VIATARFGAQRWRQGAQLALERSEGFWLVNVQRNQPQPVRL